MAEMKQTSSRPNSQWKYNYRVEPAVKHFDAYATSYPIKWTKVDHDRTLYGYEVYNTNVGKETGVFDQGLIDVQNKLLNLNLAKTRMDGTGYPGPLDARLMMAILEKRRAKILYKRLEEELLTVLALRRMNKIFTNRIVKSIQTGYQAVDCHLGPLHQKVAKNLARTQTADREQQEELVRRNHEIHTKKLRAVEKAPSQYGLETLIPQWKLAKRQIRIKSNYTRSAWFKDYTKNVGGVRPKRRAPPQHIKPEVKRIDDQSKRSITSCLADKIIRS